MDLGIMQITIIETPFSIVKTIWCNVLTSTKILIILVSFWFLTDIRLPKRREHNRFFTLWSYFFLDNQFYWVEGSTKISKIKLIPVWITIECKLIAFNKYLLVLRSLPSRPSTSSNLVSALIKWHKKILLECYCHINIWNKP